MRHINFFIFLITLPSFLMAGGDSHHVDFPLYSIIPFLGILLSIAIFPLISHHFWEKNYGKISLFWAMLFLIPFVFSHGFSIALYHSLHVILLEYIPFIILLLALYTVAGGICLKGTIVSTPMINLGFLSIGTLLASWMGTTGAAMLLIRPLIRANKWRKYKTHIIVFFIFLVANIGGALTPLGDPPLFLGFLHGVNFFWTTKAMLFPMLFVSLILLVMFFVIDSYYHKKDLESSPPVEKSTKLQIFGNINFVFLIGVIFCVLMSGVWNPHIHFNVHGVHVEIQNIVRDILLLFIVYLSIKMTDMENRNYNGFTWFPITEVAKLFIAIFITIIPAISMLKDGLNGPLHSLIAMVQNADGSPINESYFWITGILSAFLDNAPTYLIFFNTAGGDAEILMSSYYTLFAISAGAVFMGAMTYIGNAPNFMVRSIAEESGIKMPSFFGYMLWSVSILGVTLFVFSKIFIK